MRVLTAGSAAAVAVIAGALLAGCTGSTDTDTEAWGKSPVVTGRAVPGTPIPKVTKASQISLPFTELEMTADDWTLLTDARDVLFRRCMLRFGVRSTAPHVPFERDAVYDPGKRYGLLDLDSARRKGYGLYNPNTNGPDPYKIPWNPSDHEFRITYGENPDGSPLKARPVDDAGQELPPGGCKRPGATPELVDDDAFDPAFPEMITRSSFDRAQADQRTIAVEKAWVACMAKRGYKVRSRENLVDGMDVSRPASREQIRAATADVQCKYDTNYAGVWMYVETEYQQADLAEHETEVREYLRARDHVLDNARRIIAEG